MTTTTDRRSALKARHRQAIVDAARALIDERGGPQFGVDELALRADVSRRTVFNHFESLDDVILAACIEILDGVVAAFRAAATADRGRVADDGLGAIFEELVATLRTVDLPQRTAYLWRALGGADAPLARQQQFMQVALSRVADDLVAEVSTRHPLVDALEVRLLGASLLHGVAIVADRWIQDFGGAVTPASRADFDRLLERLVTRMRTGYGAGRADQ